MTERDDQIAPVRRHWIYRCRVILFPDIPAAGIAYVPVRRKEVIKEYGYIMMDIDQRKMKNR